MKFESINRRYTEVIAEWLAKGYTINSATMSGHQGEISKIDLTDGKEIIRITLDTACTNEHIQDENGKQRYYHFDMVALIVGRATDRVFPHSSNTFGDTIWNNRLEEIYREEFYQIGERNGRHSRWYGTKKEAVAQQDKRWDRYRTSFESKGQPLGDAAKEIVLPFVRRQPRCKTVRLSEIEHVTKQRIESRTGKQYTKYSIKVRGQVFDLH